jgi:hypothetical protein
MCCNVTASGEDDMSFSESLPATQNIDELERRLRSINLQETSAEDARIVELAGRLAPTHPSRSLQAVSQPRPTDTKPMQPLELTMQRSSTDEMLGDSSETANTEVEAGQTLDFDDPYSRDPNEVEFAVKKGSEGWKLRVSALALGCMVIVGALFDFAHAPPGSESLAGAFVPAAAGAEQSPSSVSGETPVAASVSMPFVAAPVAAPPPMASQSPDPQIVTATSLRPDRTPIATPPHSATDWGKALQTSDAPKPTKRRPKAASETAGSAQPLNPKLDLPMKHLGKSTARIVLAEAGAIDPAAPAETPVQLGAPAKPQNASRAAPQAPLALPEPQPAPAGLPASAQQPGNPVGRASGELVSAGAMPAQSARQRVDPSAATMSNGWAVQLAAPKSETEAKSGAARLNARYASALNGEVVGVSKAQVNGATVYRLRIVGLSKSDAAALCARVKVYGGNCFVAKQRGFDAALPDPRKLFRSARLKSP